MPHRGLQVTATYPPSDWSGLLWETRGYLFLEDGAPVPLEELRAQARAHGYTKPEIEQGLSQSATLNEVEIDGEPHVLLEDPSDTVAGNQGCVPYPLDELGKSFIPIEPRENTRER